jgi:hypothetical protein
LNAVTVCLLSTLLLAAPGEKKAGPPSSGIITRPIPRTTLWVKPFTASGYQYWEPDRGRLVASLVKSRLASTGRFAVLDSLAWARDDSIKEAKGVISRTRYEIHGQILKLGTRHSLVLSAVEPLNGGTGETVRTWRDEVGTLELLDRAAEKLVKRMAAEFPLRHVVVRVELNEVDIELGTSDGIAEGQTLDVYRRLGEIQHPLTGARVEWRLMHLGTIKVVWVGRRLSRARIEQEKFTGSIQPGDWIE